MDWESFGLPFNDLLCSADAVITKPGYGTFTEAACNGIPVLYQRRGDWPEQEPLIAWLQEKARCAEVSARQLTAGEIGNALRELWARPAPIPPEPTGAAEAAAMLLKRESSPS
jgi:UDP-N-acetylglucosamine:LPS N-acetylglucosamine transferase